MKEQVCPDCGKTKMVEKGWKKKLCSKCGAKRIQEQQRKRYRMKNPKRDSWEEKWREACKNGFSPEEAV